MVTQPTNPVPSDSCCLISVDNLKKDRTPKSWMEILKGILHYMVHPKISPLQKRDFTSGTPYHFSGFPCLANFVSGNFAPNKGTSVFGGSWCVSVLPSFASLKDCHSVPFHTGACNEKSKKLSKAQGAATANRLIPEIVFSKGVERKQNSDAHKSHSIHRTGLFTLQFPIKTNHIMYR